MDLTKLQICRAAKELFNERGLSGRFHTAGVSLGMLTYPYSRKQDLMEAIMDDAMKTFSDTALFPSFGLRDT